MMDICTIHNQYTIIPLEKGCIEKGAYLKQTPKIVLRCMSLDRLAKQGIHQCYRLVR